MKPPFLTMTRPLFTSLSAEGEKYPLCPHSEGWNKGTVPCLPPLPHPQQAGVSQYCCDYSESSLPMAFFLSLLCIISFFSLSCDSEWTPSPKSLRPPCTPQVFHLCHIMTPENFPWSLFYFIGFSNPFPNIFLDFFPSATAFKPNSNLFTQIEFIFLRYKFLVKKIWSRVE